MCAYGTRIGHAHLKVRNLQRAVDFYTRFLGLRLVEQIEERYAFLSNGYAHHEIALQQLGPGAAPADPAAIGLYHVAFEAPDRRSLALAFSALRDSGVDVSAVDHGISWALYFADPDGNGLELYVDTRGEEQRGALWRGYTAALTSHEVLAELHANDEQ